MSIESLPYIGFKLMREGARLPKRATSHSGALDLFSPVDGIVPPHSRLLVPTGVAHQIPLLSSVFQIQGVILSRSGLAAKEGIRSFFEGLIDHDYRGEIHITLENTTDKPFHFKAGDRLVQIMYVPAFVGRIDEMESLTETSRGSGGFGSTGRGE